MTQVVGLIAGDGIGPKVTGVARRINVDKIVLSERGNPAQITRDIGGEGTTESFAEAV